MHWMGFYLHREYNNIENTTEKYYFFFLVKENVGLIDDAV